MTDGTRKTTFRPLFDGRPDPHYVVVDDATGITTYGQTEAEAHAMMDLALARLAIFMSTPTGRAGRGTATAP